MDFVTKKAILTVAATSLVFTVIGTVIGGIAGFLLGTFLPAYYRSLFWRGEPGFNSVKVGIGLGIAQGLIFGLLMGVVVGLAILFINSRTQTG